MMSKNCIQPAKARSWNEGTPQINVSSVFGARPGSPFFCPIPTTGSRPLTFAADGLPEGLSIDAVTGIITGQLDAPCEVETLITASNVHGKSEKALKIVIGEKICLTPPLGWNSWNVWGSQIDEEKIRSCADSMVSSGLAAHGFSYVNIDDGWQGERGGPRNALQANEKFRDMKALCDYGHSLGLRLGIYSTPWVRSYADFNGGSTGEITRFDDSHRDAEARKQAGHYFGETPYHIEDAQQWADWGIDYLKYDWCPWEISDVEAMGDALMASGRDIVYSLSNSAPFEKAADWARLVNCWRTTGDINDSWDSLSRIGFTQDRWTPFGGPGHWNDPDMLVVGKLGWGDVRENKLTHDEQITHMTLWALLAAPLLLGCDMAKLDEFTIDLVSNDEMLAINQDPLGEQGHCLFDERRTDRDGKVSVYCSVYERKLSDGSRAVGLFNRGDEACEVTVLWKDLGITGDHSVRDVWAQEDRGKACDQFSMGVPSHGAQFIVLSKV